MRYRLGLRRRAESVTDEHLEGRLSTLVTNYVSTLMIDMWTDHTSNQCQQNVQLFGSCWTIGGLVGVVFIINKRWQTTSRNHCIHKQLTTSRPPISWMSRCPIICHMRLAQHRSSCRALRQWTLCQVRTLGRQHYSFIGQYYCCC